MRSFGSECLRLHTEEAEIRPQLFNKGIFIGFDKGGPAYLVYFTESGEVLKYRVVKFNAKNARD